MKLQTVHVTNFRSAEDSEVFQTDQVTCLVGKNEAGKSAILLALAALNPHPATPAVLDRERDYPRRSLTQYDQKHPAGSPAVAITTTWRLHDADMAKIAASVGGGVLSSDMVTASRAYGQDVKIEAKIDYKAALESLYSKFALDESERSALGSVNTTSTLIQALPKLSSPTTRHQELQAYLAQHGTVNGQVQTLIRGLLPKFMYFAAYDRMAGAIQIEQTKALIPNGQIAEDGHRAARLFVEFLGYAGVSIDEITNVATYETFNAKLQAASNNITDQILEYWTQNPDLSVNVRIEQSRPGDPEPLNAGTIAWARIYNGLHRVDTPFSERSAGFCLALLLPRQIRAGKERIIARSAAP